MIDCLSKNFYKNGGYISIKTGFIEVYAFCNRNDNA